MAGASHADEPPTGFFKGGDGFLARDGREFGHLDDDLDIGDILAWRGQ